MFLKSPLLQRNPHPCNASSSQAVRTHETLLLTSTGPTAGLPRNNSAGVDACGILSTFKGRKMPRVLFLPCEVRCFTSETRVYVSECSQPQGHHFAKGLRSLPI